MSETATTDKRTAILQTTLDLVAEYGLSNAPISAIAERSAVSTGIIYHYFTNKDALLHALYGHIKQQLSAVLLAGSPLDLPWPQNLQRVWLNAYRFYVGHPKETLFIEQFENSPYYAQWTRADYDENTQHLMGAVDFFTQQGKLKALPYEAFHELTLGVAIGLAKRVISGSVQLSEAVLNDIALSCCRAVEA